MNRFFRVAAAAIVLLAVGADCAWAGQAKGGKGRRANNDRNSDKNDKNDRGGVDWADSQSAAIEAAAADQIPVMAVIRRNLVPEDQKAVERMASWPQVAQMSEDMLVAIKVGAEGPEGKELIAKLGLKTMPAIAWLDSYGNPLLGQALPESAAPIQAVVQGWTSTLAGIQKFFKDHESKADKFLARGKLREAYMEYSFGAAFKGPDAERARAGQNKVKERWQQLLDYAATLPADSSGRMALIKGLRKDALGTEFTAQIEQAAQKGSAAAPQAAAAEANKPALVAEDKPAPVLAAVENKSLTEVMNASARLSSTIERESADDLSLDTRALQGKSDERLKEAEKLLQDGLSDYKKAMADSGDRGAARNGLLKSAHAKFEKTLSLLDQTSGGKPDAATEKLMEKTSMLMYGSLKYQSL